MPSKKAPATASRALTVWEQKMASAAAKGAKAEKVVSGLRGISLRGGILSVDDQPVPGNELSVVILVSVHENQYYSKPYNPDVPAIPDCYSFGDPEADEPENSMAPHEESPDKQGDDNGLCLNCWANAMGSASVGRGKACKNVRRIALVTSDALESAEAMTEAEVRVMKLPVMSVKGWALYVRNTLSEELTRPCWGVVTKIKVVPDAKSQFRVTFTFEELIDFDDALYAALEKKIADTTPQLIAPYVQMEEAPAPTPRGRPAPAPRGRPAPAPLKPQGRAAQAMAAAAAKKAPPAGAKKAKY